MPHLFLIVGPSGVGKTTLIDKALASLSNLKFIPSYTTRAPRSGEEDGVNYFFASEERFKSIQSQGGFLEVDRPFGTHAYGVPSRPMVEAVNDGYSVLRAMSVEGVRQIASSPLKEFMHSIFLYPDHRYDLERALITRDGSVDPERKKRFFYELDFANQCDSIIISKYGDPDDAYKRLVDLVYQADGNGSAV